jgi:hypothetical protein
MLPDAGIAGPVASANAASATPSGERKTTWCERHHGPAYGRDALREIQREISASGYRKVSPYCRFTKKGDDAKLVFLSMGPSPRHVA